MSFNIDIQQEQVKIKPWLCLYYAILGFVGLIAVLIALYFFFKYPASNPIVIIGIIIIAVLCSYVIYDSLYVYLDLDGRALIRFKKDALESIFPPLIYVGYANSIYLLWLSPHWRKFRRNIPVIVGIPASAMNRLIQIHNNNIERIIYSDNSATIETKKEKISVSMTDAIAVDLIQNLMRTPEKAKIFLAFLKSAKDKPTEQLPVYSIHPLLLDDITHMKL